MEANDYIELAERLKRDYALQTEEDDKVASLLQRDAPAESGQPPPKPGEPKVRRYSSGTAGQFLTQYLSVLTGRPYSRAFSMAKKEDEKSSEIENATIGMWQLASRNEDVWYDMGFDFCWSGRGVGFVCRAPQLWGDKKYLQGEDETDEDYVKRYKELKKRTFPVIWRYVDARDVFFTFLSLTGEVDEALEIKEMTVREVRRTYKAYAVPDGAKDEDKVTCYYYADWEKVVTVIGGTAPQVVREWNHDMGMNPYVLMERPRSAPRKAGMRWQGVLYHGRDSVDAIDSLVSDAMYNIKRATRQQPVVTTDPNSPVDAEDRIAVKVNPVDPIILPPGMDIHNLDPAKTNTDTFQLLSFLHGNVTQNLLSPALQGQLISGSGANYNATAQFAQRQHNPEVDALKRGAVAITQRMLRSVELMDEEVPIFYSDELGHEYDITLDPKEMGSWIPRVSARLELSIPLHEGALIEQAILLTRPDHQLMPREAAMERYLRDENSSESEKRIRINRLAEALLQLSIQLAGQKFAASLSSPPPNLTEEIKNLPPEVQAALAAEGPPGAPPPIPSNGAIARAGANQMKAGQLPGEYDVGQGEPMAGTVGV